MPFDGVGYISSEPLHKIDAVIDLLSTPDKWCKGALRSHDGRYCIRGAVMSVGATDALEPMILQAIAFYLLAAYPPSPFIGASREVAGSSCFPIFPPEGKDVRAAREQSSGKRYLFGCRGRSCYGRRNTRLCRRMIDGDRLLASAFKRHETFLKRFIESQGTSEP